MKKIINLKKLAISCGGTGGHFFPGLTIARNFANRDNKTLMLLGGKNTEGQSKIAKDFGLETLKLKAMPAPRGIIASLAFIYGTIRGTISSIRTMRKFKPDALLAMGSFASMPAVLAAKLLRIPLFLHDGNARVGRANRFFSSYARFMGTAFPAVNGEKIRCPHECTGMPVRPELDYSSMGKEKAITKLNSLFKSNLKTNLPTLLIFGGSQGAQIFNEVFPKMMLNSKRQDFQVLHLTGKGKFDTVKGNYQKAEFPVLCLAETLDMHYLYQAADAVICRSGGSTIAELCLFGKFSFLIPYPFAAEKHQDDNARFAVSTGAAEMLDNSKCSPKKMTKLLERWLADPTAFAKRGKQANAYAKADAADDMLFLIDSLL